MILGEAIAKDFLIPEIFVNPKLSTTNIVSMPLEIFQSLNFKIDLLKSEMMAGYLREMNVVDFIEEKFNKRIISILDKDIISIFNQTKSVGKLSTLSKAKLKQTDAF